jgi:hypothetical protein
MFASQLQEPGRLRQQAGTRKGTCNCDIHLDFGDWRNINHPGKENASEKLKNLAATCAPSVAGYREEWARWRTCGIGGWGTPHAGWESQ